MRKIHSLVRSKRFTAMQQMADLKSQYNFSNSQWRIRPHGFTWLFNVTPTALSDTYTLKMVYNEPFFPNVYVISPKPLTLAEGAIRLPHTYDTKKAMSMFISPSLWRMEQYYVNSQYYCPLGH